MPIRIQRKRQKGWRKPQGSVVITRPSGYANRFRINSLHPIHGWPMSREEVVDLFEEQLLRLIEMNDVGTRLRLDYLRGRDLVCWCKLDQKCHGDIWLREANR